MRVGPTFKLKLYYMFTASVRPKSVKIWVREIDGKKKKKSKEFIYELVLIEVLNDGRYHEEFEMWDKKKPEIIPGNILVSDISRLYYTSPRSLLNWSPVLVLKL